MVLYYALVPMLLTKYVPRTLLADAVSASSLKFNAKLAQN